MTTLDGLIEPLRHSPRLPEAVEELQRQLASERQSRQRFYEEMTPEQKIEFIDGEVVLHSPARRRHLDATKLILKLLDTHVSLNRLGMVQSEKCLCVFPRNDYEPDIVYFGPEKAADIAPDALKFPVPDLVVEVLSESTEERDRGVKFEDYAAHGVSEYWIVDAETSVLEQHVLGGADGDGGDGGDGTYDLRLRSSSGRVESVAIPGFATEVEAFFDEEKNLAALKALMA